MTIFRRFTSFFRTKSRRTRPPRKRFSKKHTEYRIKLLDNTYASFYMEPNAYGCDLLNQVFIQLDLLERDYFGLLYKDKRGTSIWFDPVKKLLKQAKDMLHPYELELRVKFYAIDPDQLNEELTRYHFFLQLKDDIAREKTVVNEQMAIELAALAAQSELGDFDPQINETDYLKELFYFPNQQEDFPLKVEQKYKDLMGMTPGECEINFLKRIKCHEFYGIEQHIIYGEGLVPYKLGFGPRGIMLLKDELKMGFYPWNRVNMIAFKKKNIRFLVHNRLDPHVIDKYNFSTCHSKIAKVIWKSAIEHHSFFRLIKTVKNYYAPKSYSTIFASKFRYSGRTFYEASEEAAKLSKRTPSFKRHRSMTQSQRTTVGYIRIGSRVFARAENGEYFRGTVVALSDKVYVKCDDGVTLAHQKNTNDCVVYDSCPDPFEVQVGTRVIAHWPGISNYLPGNVSSIDGSGSFSRFLISFDDGDTHWNNIDQLRILKPPMFFGPGSNTSYLQKKFSMLKMTTLVNTKIRNADQSLKEASEKEQTVDNELKDASGRVEEKEKILQVHPRTTSSIEKV